MTKFFNYYNSLCVGVNTPNIFTFDPYISAVKDFFLSEIKQMIFYIEKLKELNIDMGKYRDKVIDFISIIIANLDFTRDNFFLIVDDLHKNKINIKEQYIQKCKEQNVEPILLNEKETDISTKEKIIKLLNEYEQNKANKEEISKNKKCLFGIIINLILNTCNSLLKLKEYEYNYIEAKDEILKLFNVLNFNVENEEKIKDEVTKFSKCNYKITKKLNEKIAENYGPIQETEVNFLIQEGKCILVSGNDLNELKMILDATKNTNINIYTHDEMINAYKYKEFNKYNNLIGHYQSTDNTFSIDFSAFPGPIFISKNSLPQIDIIKGQIYTTAKNPAFGIGKIRNNDFTELIKYSENQKGFQLNKIIKKINIGYSQEILIEKTDKICEKIINKKINNVVFIGHSDKIITNKKTIKTIKNDEYIISFGDITDDENIWFANPFYDFEMVYKIIERMKEKIDNVEERIKIIITDCNYSTISNIFNIKQFGIKEIYLGECCPNIINPTIIEGLKSLFIIKEIKDL